MLWENIGGEQRPSEMGNCLWQLINLANIYNINIQEVIDHNVEKLNNRHKGLKVAKDGGIRKDND